MTTMIVEFELEDKTQKNVVIVQDSQNYIVKMYGQEEILATNTNINEAIKFGELVATRTGKWMGKTWYPQGKKYLTSLGYKE
jgi:hypothetical protein